MTIPSLNNSFSYDGRWDTTEAISEMNLQVYKIAPAPTHTAQWMIRLLEPVVRAALFENDAPALEFRGTGKWAGWSASRDYAPDGRVALSNRMLFSSARSLIDLYLREASHSLLHGVQDATQGHGHDCAFFALNMALRLRVDSHRANDRDPVSLVSGVCLYDLQDLPVELEADSDALGRCLTWSIAAAKEMASSGVSAEGLAVENVERYEAWLAELRDQPMLDRAARKQAQGDAVIVVRLRDKLFLSNFLAGISSALLVLIAVMLWCR